MNETYQANRHHGVARAVTNTFSTLAVNGTGHQQAQLRWQQDIENLRTVVNNGKFLFEGHKKREESHLNVYKRALRRNLDWIILSVLYESIQGAPLVGMVPHTYEKGFFFNRSPEAPIQSSYETLLELYHKNFNLVTFLREQIINLVNPNVFAQVGDKSGRLKNIIKTKIGNLIEEICIKNPNLHPQLITDPRENKLESRVDAHYNRDKNIHGGGSGNAFKVKLDPFLGLNKTKQKIDEKDFSDFKIFKKMQFGYLVEKEPATTVKDLSKKQGLNSSSISAKPRRKELLMKQPTIDSTTLNPPHKLLVYQPSSSANHSEIKLKQDPMALAGDAQPSLPAEHLSSKAAPQLPTISQKKNQQTSNLNVAPNLSQAASLPKLTSPSALQSFLTSSGSQPVSTKVSALSIPNRKFSITSPQHYKAELRLPTLN